MSVYAYKMFICMRVSLYVVACLDLTGRACCLPIFQKPWTGMKSTSMFKRPKANVLLTVVTSSPAGSDLSSRNVASFPVDAVSIDLNAPSV